MKILVGGNEFYSSLVEDHELWQLCSDLLSGLVLACMTSKEVVGIYF